MAEIREIKSLAELDLLRRFISECFKPSFPGDDERDIEAYFQRSLRGEFGADVPHIIVATEGNDPIAGCVCVYLAEPNAGVVEYVVVKETHRGGSGLVTPVYDLAVELFKEDAARRGLQLTMFLDEMEDPFRTPLPTWTKVDRFKRVGMAHNGGYKMLDFPYVERNLQVPGQTGVHTLMLMALPTSAEFETSVPASWVRTFVQSYFKWDGRDDTPGPATYRGVLKSILDYLPPGDEPVQLFDLSDYACCDESKAPIVVEAGTDPSTWSIRRPEATAPEATASFVSTPTVAFSRELRVPTTFDQRELSYLCSRIEKQMIQNGNLSLGWYVQCSTAAERDALLRLPIGFHELDVPFDPKFLLYKPYGRPHRTPRISVADFLDSMPQILDDPGACSRFAQALAGLDLVPLKPKKLTATDFGYGYFDDPEGTGYQGYQKDFNGDQGDQNHLPRRAALEFCQAHDVKSVNDWGCAKGYLVEELIKAGIDAVGYDISEYAVSFIQGVPCYVADIRTEAGRPAEATFVLGVLQYLSEHDLPRALANIRKSTSRFFLFEMYYEGVYQKVPDALRVITRPQAWWRQKIEEAGFRYDSQASEFEVFTATGS